MPTKSQIPPRNPLIRKGAELAQKMHLTSEDKNAGQHKNKGIETSK